MRSIKKSQAAAELLIILAISLFIFLLILVLNQRVIDSTSGQFEYTKAKSTVDDIVNAAELVYQEGVGARTRVYVTIPTNVQDASVSSKTVSITMLSGGGVKTVHRTTSFDILGSIPINEGSYWIDVEAMAGYVNVGEVTPLPSCTDAGGTECCSAGYICGGTPVSGTNCPTVCCDVACIPSVGTCTDGIKNQDETDIDCGGTVCPACADGKACLLNSDCQSSYCNPNNLCSTPSCSDGWKNQDESDVDCGGICGATCLDGQKCNSDADCVNKCDLTAVPPVCYTPVGDVNPPVVVLENPPDSTIDTDGIVIFDFNVNDAESAIASCDLLINGLVDQTDTTITEGITQSFAKTMSGGTYTWNVRCTDNSPNANVGSGTQRTIIIAICGDNRIDGNEVCDGTNLGGQTCITWGFAGGTLQCLPNCAGFDTSGCYISCQQACSALGFGQWQCRASCAGAWKNPAPAGNAYCSPNVCCCK